MRQAIWWAALLAGCSYLLPVLMDWHGPGITAWKGLSVGLLALWAGVHARTSDGWLITFVLALGCLGDILLDVFGLKAGALAFVAGHLLAIYLYLRNRRSALSPSQLALVLLLPPTIGIISWAIVRENSEWPIAVGYATIAAVMASAAWASRFPRYRVGVGALFFVLSDLCIFAGETGLLPPEMRRISVWPLYFAAQALIAWGVVTTLRDQQPSLR